MRNRLTTSFTVLALGVAAAGCKDDSQSKAPATPTPAPATPAAPQPKEKEGDAHAGPKHDLGSQQAGGHTVKATQFGAMKPGGEAVFELAITGGTAKPTAVRAWVGTEAGEGSAKAKASAEGDDYDVHVELPATLAQESKLWVELETPAGSRKASFDLAAR